MPSTAFDLERKLKWGQPRTLGFPLRLRTCSLVTLYDPGVVIRLKGYPEVVAHGRRAECLCYALTGGAVNWSDALTLGFQRGGNFQLQLFKPVINFLIHRAAVALLLVFD